MNTNAVTTIARNSNIVTRIDVLTVEPDKLHTLVHSVHRLAEMLV